MSRPLFVTLLAAASLSVPAPALAGDSLLSGYGGPGGGEQVVLGSKLLPDGGKGGKAGLRDRGPRPPAVAPNAALPSGGPAQGLPQLGAAPASAGTKAAAGSTGASGPGTSSGASDEPLTPVRAAADRAYTTSARTGDAGGAFDGTDLLIVALAGGLLALTAVGTRRLVAGSGAPDPGSAGSA